MTVRVSPTLAGLGTYPFVRLEEARIRLRAAGVEIVDFGAGEPREETPEFIRRALADEPLPPRDGCDRLIRRPDGPSRGGAGCARGAAA